VSLPELGVGKIKAKVDTGARSSALHAFRLREVVRDGVAFVRFDVHPAQRSAADPIPVEFPVHDRRSVRSSDGRVQTRYVIRTLLRIGDAEWPIDLTLSRRDDMGFRMLLGREAIRGRFVVDPARSHVASPKKRNVKKKPKQKQSTHTAEEHSVTARHDPRKGSSR
jgi:hypothetical protein